MVENIFTYWYLLPISIVIATIAISSGIGGAVFFSPLFMLGLKVDPYTAIGAGLITELFGFGSGLYAYIKAKLIDYQFGKSLLFFSITASILGVFLSRLVPHTILKTIFAIGIIFVGWQLYLSLRKDRIEKEHDDMDRNQDLPAESVLRDRNGNVYRYTICNKSLAKLFASIGGLFFGSISVGLAELQEYQLLVRCRIPTRIAVATTIFLVAVTVFVVSIVRIFIEIGGANYEELKLMAKIILFTAPGVLIGGQLGPYLQQKVNPSSMKLFISILLILVGVFLLLNLILTWS